MITLQRPATWNALYVSALLAVVGRPAEQEAHGRADL